MKNRHLLILQCIILPTHICRMFLKKPFLLHTRAQDVDIQIVSYVYKIAEEHLKGIVS
jgi:hypothetical protein